MRRRLLPRSSTGEAIIVNLSNGMYYSMDRVGGLIWEMIEGQSTLEETVAEIIARYDVSSQQAQADVQRVADELVQENLVIVSDQASSATQTREIQGQPRLPYESPRLNIYHDMSDLLALDPPMPSLEEIPWKESTEGSSG
jgi:hypothetical protein